MMKNNFRLLSLLCFVLSIPSLIVVDWFYKGYGLLVMFIFLTIGLVFDQIMRMKYPHRMLAPLQNYRTNKLLNLFALILFVQAPIALIYGNQFISKFGFWLMFIMVCSGIILNQIARLKFNYQEEKGGCA